MSMGDWKRKVIKKKGKASQTPGKSKCETCQADTMKRYMAGRSRSYKHPMYWQWCAMMDAANGGQRKNET